MTDLRVVRRWTPEDGQLAIKLRDSGLSHVEIGSRLGRGRKAVESFLRRGASFSPRKHWNDEMDALVREGGGTAAIRQRLAEAGFPKPERSIRRRVQELANQSVSGIPFHLSGDDRFQAAMMAAGYEKTGPDKRPGTEKPQFVKAPAFVSSKSALADL